MSQVTLYIATSLDGYIATINGDVDWLSVVDSESEDYGYFEFYQSIDALIMGSNTYQQVVGFGAWPYQGKPSYVFSKKDLSSERKDIFFTTSDLKPLIDKLASQGRHKIWLVGGAQLVTSFVKNHLIDEYIISIIPTILGDGIRLFHGNLPLENLTLIEHKKFPSGLIQLKYQQKNGFK